MLMVRSATKLYWKRWAQELPIAMSPSLVRIYIVEDGTENE
jgi:hypothetical protein